MAPTGGQAGRHLVLVGLGHVHMRLLARSTEWPEAFDVTVVAPHDARYGGAVASMLTGVVPQARLRLTPPANVSIQHNRAVGAKPLHRRLWLADGSILAYDALSLNVGTRRLPAFVSKSTVGQPQVWSGHSMIDLIGLRQVLASQGQSSVAIAGDTARAREIAGGLSAWGQGHRVVLLRPSPDTRRGDRRAYQRLAWRGVDIVPGAQMNALGHGCVYTVDGRRFAADHLLWAGPPSASSFVQALGLPIMGPGLQVDRRLQSPRASTVFAAGAMASMDGREALPGWDAERQADVILANLHGLYGSRSLSSYRAPRSGARPLDLGGDEIIAGRGCRWLQQRRLRAERARWLGREV